MATNAHATKPSHAFSPESSLPTPTPTSLSDTESVHPWPNLYTDTDTDFALSPAPSTVPSDDERPSQNGSDGSTNTTRRGRSGSSPISEPTMDEAMMDGVRDGLSADRKLEAPRDNLSNGVQEETKTMEGSESVARSRGSSGAGTVTSKQSHDSVQRLTAAEMQALTSSPESLPVAPAPPQRRSLDQEQAFHLSDQREALRQSVLRQPDFRQPESLQPNGLALEARGLPGGSDQARDRGGRAMTQGARTVSTPPSTRTPFEIPRPTSSPPRRNSFQPRARPTTLQLSLDGENERKAAMRSPSPTIKSAHPATALSPADSAAFLPSPQIGPRPPSPIPSIIPLPPMSIPTHLQLELAAQRPSPLYIHQSPTSDIPYESSAVKFERLKNVLLLPSYLERTLHFGALACLDAWLYNFTILPIRFILALTLLAKWWGYVLAKEVKWLVGFVWYGLWRLWERGRTGRFRRSSDASDNARSRSRSDVSEVSTDVDPASGVPPRPRSQRTESMPRANGRAKFSAHTPRTPRQSTGIFRHRRTKSAPSNLSSFHKADLLQGFLIICSSIALMTLDASRMYHFIRAQSAIKLYVIYNILEVGDRLLSALGQDILECLFSNETLSRNAFGRSKVLLPLGMFILALAYNCLHSITLYYQVITLNVAVNSYSNALLTLLLSNQFVEIKSTVFKRIEKDNLFQLTCADIVERFHLWIMLLIIGMRNVVEVGGLSVPGAGAYEENSSQGGLHNPSILPHSFTVLPSWLMSGEVLSPFLIVIGSEMLVDAIKHAYVSKFNNIKPTFYSRMLDILCKDHYTNSFTSPSLTRRLGLAVIPLSCLFIRASVQTYHMFLSTHLSMPMPQSTQTSLTEESAQPSSPAMMAALNRFDSLIRDSLGRATYGYPYGSPLNSRPWYSWTSDDFIAALTMVVFFFITFLVLLILKLLLGMLLLRYSRNRYAKMKRKESLIAAGKLERDSYDAKGRRTGGHGEVEMGDERQRWVHADQSEGLPGGKGPGGKRIAGDDKKKHADGDFSGISRFEMVAKRIW